MDLHTTVKLTKALATIAKLTGKGHREVLESEDKHITHTITVDGNKVMAIIATDEPSIANLATLEAYKVMRGWKYAVVIVTKHLSKDLAYYQEVSKVEGYIAAGKFTPDITKFNPIQL